MNRRISVVWMILVFSGLAFAVSHAPSLSPLNQFAVTVIQRLQKEDVAPQNHVVAAAPLAEAWLSVFEAAVSAQKWRADPLLKLDSADRSAWRASLRELLSQSGAHLKRAFWEAQDSTVARPLRLSLGETLFQTFHKPAAEIPPRDDGAAARRLDTESNAKGV